MPKLFKLTEERKEPDLPDGNPARLLDFQLIRAMAKLIARGLPFDGACDFFYVPQTTASQWVRKGKSYLLGDGQPPESRIYGIFVQAMARAMADYRRLRLKYLHDPDGDPKARMIEYRILQTRDRKNFGKFEPVGGMDELPEASDEFL